MQNSLSILPRPLPGPPLPSGDQNSAQGSASPSEDLVAPFRLTALTSRHYFYVSRRIWDYILLSLPLDLLLLLLPHLRLEIYETPLSDIRHFGLLLGSLLFVGSILLWVLRDAILDLLFALTHIQQRLAVTTLWPVLALIGIVAVTTLLELASHFSEINLTSVVVTILVLFGTVSSILKAARERRSQATELSRDRTGKIEQANQIMGTLSLLPMGFTRLASLILVLTLVTTNSSFFEVLFAAGSAGILLLAFKPTFEQFTFACARCGILTSRALKAGSFCPMCLMARRSEGPLYVSDKDPLSLRLLRKAEKLSELAEKASELSPNNSQENSKDSPLVTLSKTILSRLNSRTQNFARRSVSPKPKR